MALALSRSMGTPNRVGFPLRSQPAELGSEDLLSRGERFPPPLEGNQGSGGRWRQHMMWRMTCAMCSSSLIVPRPSLERRL